MLTKHSQLLKPLPVSDGFQFYRSANGVILTPGNEHGILPTEYFEKVTEISHPK